MPQTPEPPTIRPPSESGSLLLRVTRGCHWNRCRFCGVYPALGQHHFSVRDPDRVKQDIDSYHSLGIHHDTAFLGDADPLQAGLDAFTGITTYLRTVYPQLKRVTCYARASTLWKAGEAGIQRLADAGLNRVHIGLESGDQEVLNYHRKGQNRTVVLESAGWLKNAGIEISYYVLLGLGGAPRWKEHIDSTASLLEETDPDFIRIRRIWLYGPEAASTTPAPFLPSGAVCPLREAIRSGEFTPQTPEGTVLELKRLLEKLTRTHAFFTCDHANNYVLVKGQLQKDRTRMLNKIDTFLKSDPDLRRRHYELVGSRI